MGNYSQLYLGKYYISWKNQIPNYLAFIFEDTDFFSVIDNDNDWFKQLGYKTNCKFALKKLNYYGYTIEFFSEIYDFFYNDLLSYYEYRMKANLKHILSTDEETIIDEKFWSFFNSCKKLSRCEELRDYIGFIKTILNDDFVNPKFQRENLINKLDSHGIRLTILDIDIDIKTVMESGVVEINFEQLESYLFDVPFENPPWISIITLMLWDYLKYDYEEITTLMFLRLILESINQDDQIILDLADIVEDEEEAKAIHIGLAKNLIDKINLYNKVFHSLFRNEEDIRSRYIKTQCKEYLNNCSQAKTIYEKGKALENLMEMLFTSNNSLELIDKRVSTGDEEIDLVIKNNIDRPFWLAFQSPLFFVECKNWVNPVGTKELRDFEIKIQNHSNLVQVGFFVSINGFSTEIPEELKRLGRDHYHVILLNKKDIEEFINSDKNFFDWLEGKAARFY